MRSPGQNHHPETYNIAVIDKTLTIVELLRDNPSGLSLQAITEQTGFIKSSVHRTLGSLKWHGYVEQPVAGGPYRLGMKCLLLARGLTDGVELLPHARPYMDELVDAFNESAYLAVLHGGRALFVDVRETRRRDLRLVGPLGAEVSFHATAAGKAIAAYMPPDIRRRLLERMALTAVTARTRTRRSDVEQEWAAVARRGVAVNAEETLVGALFVAAPVFDADRSVCGAISLGLPTARHTTALGRSIAARMKDVCGRLSRSLGEAGYVHRDRDLHDPQR